MGAPGTPGDVPLRRAVGLHLHAARPHVGEPRVALRRDGGARRARHVRDRRHRAGTQHGRQSAMGGALLLVQTPAALHAGGAELRRDLARNRGHLPQRSLPHGAPDARGRRALPLDVRALSLGAPRRPHRARPCHADVGIRCDGAGRPAYGVCVPPRQPLARGRRAPGDGARMRAAAR